MSLIKPSRAGLHCLEYFCHATTRFPFSVNPLLSARTSQHLYETEGLTRLSSGPKLSEKTFLLFFSPLLVWGKVNRRLTNRKKKEEEEGREPWEEKEEKGKGKGASSSSLFPNARRRRRRRNTRTTCRKLMLLPFLPPFSSLFPTLSFFMHTYGSEYIRSSFQGRSCLCGWVGGP